MKKLSAVALFTYIALAIVLSGCGGGGGSSTSISDPSKDDPTPPSDTTTLTGKVVRSDTGAGVANVNIIFGSTPITVKTASDGTFSIPLGETAILSLFPADKYPDGPTFKVDVSQCAIASYTEQWKVDYVSGGSDSPYSKVALPVSTTIMTGESTDLGTIGLYYYDPQSTSPPNFAYIDPS